MQNCFLNALSHTILSVYTCSVMLLALLYFLCSTVYAILPVEDIQWAGLGSLQETDNRHKNIYTLCKYKMEP